MDNKNNLPATQNPDIMILKFADSKVPVFKETRNKDWIKYGEKDDYPSYLTYLFNKSSKHNAIVTGKADYIFGGGFENGNQIVNRLDESLNDISKKCVLDIEIYGGCYLEIVWSLNKQICEIYHVDYSTIRKGKKGGYFFKQNWNELNNDEPIPIRELDHLNPVGNQIYSYNEYRPGVRFYPLPGYIGSNNYIETDIEISKYYLSCIRNGMMPSKLIQFFTGEPTDDKKREIELRLQKKFSGSENAGKFFMVFNGNANNKAVQIDDLSASDLDKHMDGLNKLCQTEIFSGHKVVSPMLFGIKTEGQLGGNTEIKTSYEAFVNTYAKPRAEAFSKEITFLLSFSFWKAEYSFKKIDPIGVQFDVKDVVNSLPKAFVFEQLGIPKEMWELENIGSDNKPIQTIPVKPSTTIDQVNAADELPVNDSIKNLTAKQHQQVMRIIRQYSKGQVSPGASGTLTAAAARALLRSGYGLSENDINDLLGITPIAAMKFEDQEEAIIGMFDACGDDRNDWEILKAKKVSFSSDEEMNQDEEIFIQQAFKTYDVTNSEKTIMEMIKKDPLITPEAIAEAIGNTKSYVASKINSLTKKGYLETTTETIGEDIIVKRVIPSGIDISVPPTTIKNPGLSVKIMYSYEGPQDSRNRPFCAKMMQLNRLYSRKDIEAISEKLGYSVFDRRGGFWRHKDGETTAYCRHNWKSNIVVKKTS